MRRCKIRARKSLSFLYLEFLAASIARQLGRCAAPLFGFDGAAHFRGSDGIAKSRASIRTQVRTISEQRDTALLQEKLLAALGTCFGLLALALAAVGLFGLLSFSVAARTGEMGIRMALGANRRDIVWLVVREALVLVGIGLLAG